MKFTILLLLGTVVTSIKLHQRKVKTSSFFTQLAQLAAKQEEEASQKEFADAIMSGDTNNDNLVSFEEMNALMVAWGNDPLNETDKARFAADTGPDGLMNRDEAIAVFN